MMNKEGKYYRALDQLIDEALGEAPGMPLPPGFTSRLMRKVGKRDVIRELALESTLKISLVVGAFVVLSTTFLVLGITDLHAMQSFLEKYRIIILPGAGGILFTWLFNDIILKYMFRKAGGSDGVMG